MDEAVAFEDITILVSVIHPYFTNLNDHTDTSMNDNIPGYTRAGCIIVGLLVVVMSLYLLFLEQELRLLPLKNRKARVLEVLFLHLQWVDSLANAPPCEDVTIDLPLTIVQHHMEEVCKERIAAIAKSQLNLFCLGIFTTIVSGTGKLKSGRHLKNLMFPVRGAASRSLP
jgi:hypothetical protein